MVVPLRSGRTLRVDNPDGCVSRIREHCLNRRILAQSFTPGLGLEASTPQFPLFSRLPGTQDALARPVLCVLSLPKPESPVSVHRSFFLLPIPQYGVVILPAVQEVTPFFRSPNPETGPGSPKAPEQVLASPSVPWDLVGIGTVSDTSGQTLALCGDHLRFLLVVLRTPVTLYPNSGQPGPVIRKEPDRVSAPLDASLDSFGVGPVPDTSSKSDHRLQRSSPDHTGCTPAPGNCPPGSGERGNGNPFLIHFDLAPFGGPNRMIPIPPMLSSSSDCSQLITDIQSSFFGLLF